MEVSPLSELKVLISDQLMFASDRIAIAVILQHNQDERSILHFTEEGFDRWDTISGLLTSENGGPTLSLNNDVARALLDALTRHYQGASDMHTVRADLLHERGRVDRMINAIIDLGDKAIDSATGN